MKYFYIIQLILFGLDFGFVNRRSPRSKITIRILTIVPRAVGTAVLLYFAIRSLFVNNTGEYFLIYRIIYLLQYMFNVLVLSFNISYHEFQGMLFAIDGSLYNGNRKSFNSDVGVFVTCLFYYANTIVSAFIFCFRLPMLCAGRNWELVLSNAGRLSSFTVLIVCFFTFYSVYVRMKAFVDLVRNIDGERIKDCLNIYKAIVDAVDKAKKPIYLIVSTDYKSMSYL